MIDRDPPATLISVDPVVAMRRLPRPGLIWLVSAAVVIAISAWLRLELIEPLSRAASCMAEPNAPVCILRAALVALIQQDRLGWIALLIVALGSIALWRGLARPGIWFVGFGYLLGAAALMLYSVEPGAVAVLLASLWLLAPFASSRPASSA